MTIELGVVPPYSKCFGCKISEALACVKDMRSNITGTVPYGCKMDAIYEQYDEVCCPEYNARKQAIFSTAAYPQGLECLRKVGCEMTDVCI